MATKKYPRKFAIDRGLGTEYVRWTAWLTLYPMVRGYGQTEAEARTNLNALGPRVLIT